MATAVRHAFGCPGRLRRILLDGVETRLFRFDGDDGASYFLKLVEDARRPSLLTADHVARFLQSQGIAVAEPCDGFPKPLGGDWIFAYRFVSGRGLSASPACLRALGFEIGRLHAALALCPDRPGWEAATRDRLARLGAVRRALAAGERAGPEPDLLTTIATLPALDFELAHLAATPLHGDLNPGNLIERHDDRRILFLDLEDVFHSVLAPEFELALVTERMILVPISADDPARECVRALLDGYRQSGQKIAADRIRAFPEAMRSLALRSLCTLADAARGGITVADSEWRKFFDLSELADRRRHLFDGLS